MNKVVRIKQIKPEQRGGSVQVQCDKGMEFARYTKPTKKNHLSNKWKEKKTELFHVFDFIFVVYNVHAVVFALLALLNTNVHLNEKPNEPTNWN